MNTYKKSSQYWASLKTMLNNVNIKKYVFNTGWILVENIARMMVGLLTGVFVARYLGPAQFGNLSYILAFVLFFSVIAKFGLDPITVREIVQSPESADEILGTVFWIKLGIGCCMAVLTVILASTLNHSTDINIYISIAAAGIIFQAFEVIDFYFQAIVEIRYVTICKLCQLIFVSIMNLMLIYFQKDLIWFVILNTFNQILLALFLLYAFRKKRGLSFISMFNLNKGLLFLKDSWPLVISSFFVIVYSRIDQIMIQHLLGSEQVGIYSASLKIISIWYFIPMAVGASVFPAILAAKKEGENKYYHRLTRLYSIMIIASIFFSVFISFSGDFIINILYGKSYQAASSLIKIQAWTGVFVCIQTIGGKWVITENYQIYALVRAGIGVFLNIVLNYYWINSMGINGAAYASLISLIFVSYISNLMFKSHWQHFKIITNGLLLQRNWHNAYKT